MTPRIETIDEKKLVGKKLIMSYANYTIGQLWGSFMPRRKEITNHPEYLVSLPRRPLMIPIFPMVPIVSNRLKLIRKNLRILLRKIQIV